MAPRLAALRRPALPAPPRLPRLGRPSRRALLIGLGCAAAFALAYGVARETSLFETRDVVVAGGSAATQGDVRAHLAPLGGESLVAIDADALAQDLERLPAVHAAAVDRAFPHTLSVRIEEERPLAVLLAGKDAMLVSVRGRAMRRVAPRALPRLPRVFVDDVDRLAAGETVVAHDVGRALEALAHVPPRFPLRPVSAQASEEGIAIALAHDVELRLGDATDLGAKIAAADAVLRSLGRPEREALVYVDATVPNRVVASANPQVAG